MSPPPSPGNAILTADHINVRFETAEGPVVAVDDVSFDVRQGESLSAVSYTHLTLPTNREV